MNNQHKALKYVLDDVFAAGGGSEPQIVSLTTDASLIVTVVTMETSDTAMHSKGTVIKAVYDFMGRNFNDVHYRDELMRTGYGKVRVI